MRSSHIWPRTSPFRVVGANGVFSVIGLSGTPTIPYSRLPTPYSLLPTPT
ncbi:MAG: hypothetical protein F6K49_25935 [Moorea sp. SIO3I6]|nr:hypothetical protein [Moorena sp. SIO3I6]